MLKAFVTGGDFDDDELLWELTTNLGSWYEFRITFHPQHRILGGFLRPCEFIALAHGTRKDLDKKMLRPNHQPRRKTLEQHVAWKPPPDHHTFIPAGGFPP